jgi:hypothetical protein
LVGDAGMLSQLSNGRVCDVTPWMWGVTPLHFGHGSQRGIVTHGVKKKEERTRETEWLCYTGWLVWNSLALGCGVALSEDWVDG